MNYETDRKGVVNKEVKKEREERKRTGTEYRDKVRGARGEQKIAMKGVRGDRQIEIYSQRGERVGEGREGERWKRGGERETFYRNSDPKLDYLEEM